jgi:hypothetical protein
MPQPRHTEHYDDRTFEMPYLHITGGMGRAQFRINGKVVSAAEWERQRQEAMARDASRAAAR